MRITIKPFELRGFNLSPDIFHVSLRVYALNYFVRQSDGVIVQPGGPAESPFYEEWACTRNNGSLLLPEIALESTIDALAPAHPEQLRYYAGFFDPGGNMLCAFWPRPIFALDTDPNPTTWAHVVAYNSPGVEFDWTTTHAEHYSKEEFDKLLQNPPQNLTGITVLPPLYFDGTTLWIPRASSTQDGYLAAEDYVTFSIGAGMGVISFNTRQGVIVLLSQDVLDALTYAPINKAGDTMTGPLMLYGNPTAPLEAATKAYVDAVAGGGDVIPPMITLGSITAVSITSTGATINWSTDEASTSQVEWGTSAPAYGNLTPPSPPATYVTSHSIPLTGLMAGTVYHYRVRSKDAAGNPVVSGDFTFTTASSGGDTAPNITAVNASSLTSTGATITWTTDDLSDSQVEYSTDSGFAGSSSTPITNAPASSAGVTSHSVPLTGLTPSTLYYYRVKSTNAIPLAATPVVGTPFTTSSAVDLLTGLVSYWKLDEASGTRFDSVQTAGVGHNDLTPSGPGAVMETPGKIGNCATVAGSNVFLYALNNSYQGLSGPFSICGWIKFSALSLTRTIYIHNLLAKTDGSSQVSFFVWWNGYTSGGTWEFGISPDGLATHNVQVTIIDNTPTLETWMFIAAVYDGTALKLSINDGTVSSTPCTVAPFHSSEAFITCGIGIAGAASACSTDEIGVWARALSAGEITALYGTPPGGGLTYPF